MPFSLMLLTSLHYYLSYDLIFSLTPFGWFTCMYLSLFFNGNIIFDLHYFDVCPVFREHTRASNKPFMYCSSKYTDFMICLGTKILNLPKNCDRHTFQCHLFPLYSVPFCNTYSPCHLVMTTGN